MDLKDPMYQLNLSLKLIEKFITLLLNQEEKLNHPPQKRLLHHTDIFGMYEHVAKQKIALLEHYLIGIFGYLAGASFTDF